MRCPVCNVEDPEDAKFCSQCGNRLPERRTTGSSERKVVSVLFCDVKGSTALAENVDPEDWTEVIDGAFRVLTPPIQRYGGTVARLLGDAVLAFFGAPVAHEDDPERALRAGLEMLAAAQRYRERLIGERGATFSGFDVRIGINTGLAVIGDVGGGQAVEYTGMGDAVNVAARLQSLAEPGSMLVSEHTLRSVPAVFEWEPVGDVDLKGREGRIHAFRVTGLSAAGRARARGLVTPLVGRDAELASLRAALREIARGSGRIVALIGDAGLGKTRLIDELRAEWEGAAERPTWSEARGQSYEQSRSYGLFRQLLLSLAEASEADPPDVIREKVAALLPEAQRTDASALGTLEAFLAVDPDAAAAGPEGQELRASVHRLMREVLHRVAMRQAVLVVDDLQWSDPASADLVAELLEIADEAPVLLVIAFRPDRQLPSWRIKQKLETDYPHRYTEIELRPLSASESETLLANVLPGDLTFALRGRILEKAEGNPFFLEEIVRALRDDGTVVRDGDAWRVTRPDAEIRLPDSLQSVLAARIDRLDAGPRETLQAAAVIGRTFLYRILVAIREASDTLDRQLLALQRLELVREQAREPEREYAFRHALTQEAAYRSILQRKRRELHLRVGEALEALFPDRTDEFAAVIGHHYAEAADPRAARYLKTAGDRALRLHALEDAIAHYRRATALLAADASAEVRTELYLRHGRALELRGDYRAAAPVYEELERIAKERADLAMEAAALSALTTIYSNPTELIDPAKAESLIGRQIEIAQARGDERLLAQLLWHKSQTAFWRGDLDLGAGDLLRSIEISRRLGDDEQLAYTLNTLGQSYREQNRLDEAERALLEARDLFRKVGNRPLEADSLSTLAFVHIYRGDLQKALDSGMEAYRIGQEIGNEWAQAYALFMPSFVLTERGDWGGAIASWTEMVGHAEKGGFLAGQAGPASELGLLHALSGDDETAIAMLERTLAFAREHFRDWRAWPAAFLSRVLIQRGELARVPALLDEGQRSLHARGNLNMGIGLALARGELALAGGHAEDAVRIAREDRREATERGLRPYEKDFDLLEGQALLALDDHEGAQVAFARGIAASEAIGSVRLLWQLHGGLASIAEARSDLPAARRAREAAAKVVDRIATSLRAAGLEDRFRARPAVRHALGLAGVS